MGKGVDLARRKETFLRLSELAGSALKRIRVASAVRENWPWDPEAVQRRFRSSGRASLGSELRLGCRRRSGRWPRTATLGMANSRSEADCLRVGPHQWHAVLPASVNAPSDGRKSQSYEFACNVSLRTPWLVWSRTSEFGWDAPNP